MALTLWTEFRISSKLKTDSNFPSIRDTDSRKFDLAHTVTVLVWLSNGSFPRASRLGSRVIHGDGRLRKVRALVGARVPRVVLDEANLAALDASRARRQCPASNVDGLARGGVDGRSLPLRSALILHDNIVCRAVVAFKVYSTADAGPAIGAGVAVGVRGRCAFLERGEDAVDDALAVLVGAILDAAVSYVWDAVKLELLGKVVAGGVSSAGHVERKRDVFEAPCRLSGEGPAVADES